MIVKQYFVRGIAHSSYLLGGTKTCAIVDPKRDVQLYLDEARDLDMKITHIIETHLHADFISGHLDLARATGARIYAPESGACDFDHIAVSEGDEIQIEDMRLQVLETPGHTPEHVSYTVTDEGRGKEPAGLFCGDTLFVGDVGRPDLFPGRAQELASKLYDSLLEKIGELPDFCEVYPAHGAGSLCGRAMGAKRTSTVGYEKRYNYALQIGSRQEFIDSLTGDMPPAPDHFSRCSEINRRGPALTDDLPEAEAFDPESLHQKIKKENLIVLDVRSYDSFGGQHIPNAYHIDLAGNFATFAGWILPQDAEIALIAYDGAKALEAVKQLRRVGMDNVKGYLDGGMFEWSKNGLPTAHIPQISVEELHEMSRKGGEMVLVDVRSPAEFEGFHIEGAINFPVADLRTRYDELNENDLIVLMCSTGHRSSLGCSILKQHGFRRIMNAAGGVSGYSAAGYSPVCPVCFVPHGPQFNGKKMKFD